MSQLFVAEPRNSYRASPPIVVDCSVLAATLFEEAGRDEADRILAGKALFAPWLIDHEMISVGLKKAGAGSKPNNAKVLRHLRGRFWIKWTSPTEGWSGFPRSG